MSLRREYNSSSFRSYSEKSPNSVNVEPSSKNSNLNKKADVFFKEFCKWAMGNFTKFNVPFIVSKTSSQVYFGC